MNRTFYKWREGKIIDFHCIIFVREGNNDFSQNIGGKISTFSR